MLAETVEFEDLLSGEITDLASTSYGLSLRLLRRERINTNKRIHASRATFSTNRGDTVSFIVKHYGEEYFFDEEKQKNQITFSNELSSYRFLMQQRNIFSRFPVLQEASPRIMVLQDLGGGDRHIYKTIWRELAEVFLSLHSATYQNELCYNTSVSSLGECANKVICSGFRNAALQGGELIADYIQVLDKPSLESFLRLSEEAAAVVDNPGCFHSFIHGDLVDGRQTVVLEGKIFLIDFEHSRYSHALLDLATVLLGKMERDVASDTMIYNYMKAPPLLFAYYREKLERQRGITFDESFWEKHVSSCLLFHAFAVIFSRQTQVQKHFSHNVAQSTRAVLARLLSCLEGNGIAVELQAILGRLITRII